MAKVWKVLVSFCLALTFLPTSVLQAATADDIKITADQVSASGSKEHPVKNIVDGDSSTYWQSMPSGGEGDSNNVKKETRMSDHNRYIDIQLDKTYDLSQIKLFTQVDDAYSNYYVYASVDGEKYDKIIAKTDTNIATAKGDTFTVNKRAAYLRINMAYHSNSFVTNLVDIEVKGTIYSDKVAKPKPISTVAWEDSTWKTEWDKVTSDEAYASQKTILEMSDLVGRVIGDQYKKSFIFEYRDALQDEDTYEILDGKNNTIIVRGNNGVAMASGFNYYLKNYAMVDYNPLFASNTEMKNGVVPIGEKIVKTTQYDYRYALNFCTYSYTMAFWNWDQYEDFLDWGAMNGVNLMLDIVGQEEIIRQLLSQYNYSDEEIKEYIAGPGYFAWFYMQNLYSFGGPLPNNWFEQRVELGRKMHDRMQTYGIKPVIQGFSGQVPLTFDDKNTGAVLTPLDEWPTFTRPAIVTPYLTDADKAAGKKNYFPEMAEKFYAAQKNVFGDVSNFYAADPFHEGGNTTGLQLGEIYKQVQSEMLKSDEDAVWVMQQWQGNLNQEKLSGLVKPEQGLALDLQSDLNQQNSVMESNQVPWIWNMLHNFGGRMGLDGELETIATKLPADFEKSNQMVGIGITPEALENSPVAYEMLFDMTWSKDPINYQDWVKKYAERRAGGSSEKLQKAWETLTQTAYAKKGQYFQGAAETIINATPRTSFNSASTWGHSAITYDKMQLETALALLVENYDDFKASDAYIYDLADVSEQVLCNVEIEYHGLMITALNAGNSADFKKYSDKFMEIIALSDKILSANKEFMLGTWINNSRTMLDGMDDWSKDLFEFNARALVTTWGGERSTSLNDYSNRKWAGLTKEYYGERWKIWIANRQADLDNQTKNPANVKAESNWFMWGWRWANLKSDDGFGYTTKTSTATLKEDVKKVLDTYSVTELQKNGGIVSEKVNIALNKVFTTSSTAQEGVLKDITDGSTSSTWIANGVGPHVLTLDLEGTYKISDMAIAIKQAATTYPFTYSIEYMNAEGQWAEYVAENSEGMQSNTNITKAVTASKIRLTMATSDATTYPIFLAEVAVYGTPMQTTKYINVAKGKSAVSTVETDGSSSLAYITDDDTKNLWKTFWSPSVSAMYPCDVTIDLAGTAEADFIDLYLEKAGLPYQFTVGAIDTSGKETIVLDESKTTETLSTNHFKIPMNKKNITKVVVHFIGRTGKGSAGAASPAIAECKVLSTKEIMEKKNFALNKAVTATSTQSGKSSASAVDGSYDTTWVFNGYDYPGGFWDGTADTSINPILFDVDLGNAYQIDQINLSMTKGEKKYYFFDIYVYKEGSKDRIKVLSVTPDDVSKDKPNKTKYSIPVNEKISKIEVAFRGKVKGQDGWYDIAELEAIGIDSQEDSVILKEGKIESVTTSTAYAETLDGKKSTFVNGIKDKEIVYSLGGNYYVDYAEFTFEKAALGLKYIIYAEDENGARTLILDRSNSSALLDHATVKVDVKQTATKLIFKHLGNNGKGPASLAEPRLYETEIFGGIPQNAAKDGTVTPDKAKAIVDGDNTKGYMTSKDEVITVELKKATDINMFHIVSDGNIAGQYTIELYNVDKDTWEKVYDGSENSKSQADAYMTLKESVFASKARITIMNDNLSILEFNAYAVDKTGPLVIYIDELQTLIDSKVYNGVNGSYSMDAKAKVEALLGEAKAAIQEGLNSASVTKWLTDLKAAEKDFMLNGVVYIYRNQLLRELSETDTVMKEVKDLGNTLLLTDIQKAYDEAQAIYKTYAVTQKTLDASVATLRNAKETFIASLSFVDQYKVQLTLAEKAYQEAVEGNLEGQVSKEAKEALGLIIEKAKVDFVKASEVDIPTITETLKKGLADFEASRVVVDRAPLLVLIQNAATLCEQDFDRDDWSAFVTELATAQAIYDNPAISNQMMNDAVNTLNATMSGMRKLDRTKLRIVLDKVTTLNETAYTSLTWKVLKDASDTAIQIYNSASITQVELDAATLKVQQAIDELEHVAPVKPVEPNKPDTPKDPITPVTPNPVLPGAINGVMRPTGPTAPTDTTTIAPIVKPKTETPKSQGKAEAVKENETPKAKGTANGAWALVNLVFVLVTSLFALFLVFAKSRKNEIGNTLNETAQNVASMSKSQLFMKVVSCIIAIIAIGLFIFTEDMSLSMTLVDKWTLMMIVMAVIQVAVFCYARYWKPSSNKKDTISINA